MLRPKLHKNGFAYPATAPLPFDGFGWTSTEPVFKDIIDELKPKLIIEVGTWLGASARHMVKCAREHHADVELIAVDTFLGSQEFDGWPDIVGKLLQYGRIDAYPQFLSNVIHAEMQEHITPLPLDSMNAFHVLKKLGVKADLVYIDGGHCYELVHRDIGCYMQLMRPGSIMLIDDWNWPGVMQAVIEIFGELLPVKNSKFVWRFPCEES